MNTPVNTKMRNMIPRLPSGPPAPRPAQPLDPLPQPGDLLRVEKVASLLSITRRRIYTLIESGELRAVRFGPRSIRVLKSSLETYYRKAAGADRTDH